MLSEVAMGILIVVQLVKDVETLRTQSLLDRIANHSLTSLELIVVWGLVGAWLYAYSRWRAPGRAHPSPPRIEDGD
jgi:hypothetical protein